MNGNSGPDHVVKHPRVTLLATAALSAGLWILLVGGVKGQEMLVGAGSLLLSVLFLYRLGRCSPLALDFLPRDVLTIWRLPWYILSDVWTVTVVLFLDLFARPAGSYFRVTGFETSERDPQKMARQVLATAYTTASPNSIVIGIDPKQSRLLFHQISRSKVSRMVKQLGVRA